MTMTVEEAGVIRLQGQVTVDDAEALMQALRAGEAPAVDLSACEHLHAAAMQVLLALRPRLAAAPRDPWLQAALGSLPTEAGT